MKRSIEFFDASVFEDYSTWSTIDKKVYDRILKLIKEIVRTPFEGTGKPEPLKGNRSGQWSRRITDEHRLIYRVEESRIVILSCKGHYS